MARAVAVLALLFAAATAIAQQPHGDEFTVEVTEEMIRHSRVRDAIYFGGFFYSAGVFLLVLATGISARLRDAAARVTKKPFVMAMIYAALLVVVVTLLEMPLSYYAGFIVPHQFDLSNQNTAEWLIDELKGLGVMIVIGSFLGALTVAALRGVRRWWLAIWLGSIPLIIFFVVIAPVFLDPIFNRFEPLRDDVLRRQLLSLADRAGVEGSRVYQVDKSRQTKTMNGYVTGLGPTKRIVLWDTLLAKLTHDEVLAVMGHELGHYVLHHVWKGVAAAIGIGFVVLFLAQRIFESGVARWGPRWGVAGKDDPAALPWLVIIVASIAFLLAPVSAGISRYMEREADRFSLDLTRLNEPMAHSFIKFAEDSKINPDPHPFIEFWRYSHPSLKKRIDFVLHYRPWEKRAPERIARPTAPPRASGAAPAPDSP